MIKSVDGYDIPNALVQFASEKNKKKIQRLKFTSNLAFLQVSFFFIIIQSSFGNGKRHRFKSL